MMENVKNVPALRFPEFDEGWVERRLGDLCQTFKSGMGITANNIFDSGNYPVYGGNGLRGFTESFTHDGTNILIGRQGALCGNINIAEGKAFISEHAVALKAADDFDNYWLAHKLKYMNLNQYSESSAQPGLAVNKLVKLKLNVPSLTEQQKIASFLTAVDDKIQQLSKKKGLLEQYKKGVMQQLFSQKLRFKDDQGKEYPDWEEKTLGSISEKKSSNISASSLEGNHGNYIIYGATGVLKKVDFYREEHAYVSIVKDGAGVGRVLICEPKSSVLGTLDIIVNKPDVNLYFLYSCIENIEFAKYIAGSTIPHIYFRDYSKELLAVPCIEEQTKFANFLSAIDDKINGVTLQIEHTRQFKKGLLQQLFV